MQKQMRLRAKELFESGEIDCILAWRRGDFPCETEPGFFTNAYDIDNLVYNIYCSSNLSKYMIETSRAYKRTLIFLKPCDSYSFNQLIKEHLIKREKTYIIGIGCEGNAHVHEGEDLGLLEACRMCTKTEHAVFDELINAEIMPRETSDDSMRFLGVTELENKSPEERYDFWRGQLSRCIRCNACRNVCPTCNCKKCVFDNSNYNTEQKANASSFEEQMFHIIRAYHVAGRCTDCGQCVRVCPVNIDLHLLNRKFIKDINKMYGEYQAGADTESAGPLTAYNIEKD